MKLADLEDYDRLQSQLENRFDALENKFNALENKVDARFNQLESRINRLESKLNLVWIAIATSVAQIVTTIVTAILK